MQFVRWLTSCAKKEAAFLRPLVSVVYQLLQLLLLSAGSFLCRCLLSGCLRCGFLSCCLRCSFLGGCFRSGFLCCRFCYSFFGCGSCCGFSRRFLCCRFSC